MNGFNANMSFGGELLCLQFTAVLNPACLKYFVRVTGKRTLVVFEMKREDEGWTILPPAPNWIFTAEKHLSKLIEAKQVDNNNVNSPLDSNGWPQ